MSNPLSRDAIASIGIYGRVEAVTPNDGATFAETRGIVSTDGGAVTMTFTGGGTLAITLAADQVYPFSVVAVAATGTVATEIFALY